MSSSRSDSDSVSEEEHDEPESSEVARPVAIQWHISDHFGSSRDGASGSVRVTVYVTLATELQAPVDDFGRVSVMVGSSWSFLGLIVFPSSAYLLDGHSAPTRRDGRKSSMTWARACQYYTAYITQLTAKPTSGYDLSLLQPGQMSAWVKADSKLHGILTRL